MDLISKRFKKQLGPQHCMKAISEELTFLLSGSFSAGHGKRQWLVQLAKRVLQRELWNSVKPFPWGYVALGSNVGDRRGDKHNCHDLRETIEKSNQRHLSISWEASTSQSFNQSFGAARGSWVGENVTNWDEEMLFLRISCTMCKKTTQNLVPAV